MASTPMVIRFRPFSVEPFTNVMLPDGIFDTALRRQQITCYYTNRSNTTLSDVRIYLEGISDPGIVPTPRLFTFARIEPGASVRVAWLANFELGTPGKKLVSFVAQAQGLEINRTLKHIFVSTTVRDEETGEYRCTVPEGTLTVSRIAVIGPRANWRSCRDRNDECPPNIGPWVPTRVTMSFAPNPPYAGLHGDLPFGDPWWKILGWVVFAIAAIVAIVAALEGEGTAGVTVSGRLDEPTGTDEHPGPPEVYCCDVSGPPSGGLTIAGIASAIAVAALAVGLADTEDPWWRGQAATAPPPDVLTVAEAVDAHFSYPAGAPHAGEPYPVQVRWTYTRKFGDGSSKTYEVAETQKNTHVSDGIEIETPAVHYAFTGSLVVKTRFRRGGGDLFKGEALYAFYLLRSPDNLYFVVHLGDDGEGHDNTANDGTYTGGVDFKELYPTILHRKGKLDGFWHVYVFAQDVNHATPDMLPQVAAQQVGGFVVASGIQVTFDPSLPCPLQSHAVVHVIA
jgi:hypothetical protein